MRAPLFTVGHGASSAEELLGLLRSSGIEALVDIRRFPGSAAHPHLGREAMESWLPDGGVATPRPHQPAAGARVGDDGQLVWDAGAGPGAGGT